MEVTGMRALLLASLALVTSCDGSSDNAPRLSRDSCPSISRPSITLADQLPRVALSPEAADWDAMSVPMSLQGADIGDQSVVYGAMLMGYYLIGVQRGPDCKDELKPELPCTPFAYEFDPRTATNSDHDAIGRQLVATLTQTWMYRITGRPEFRRSADVALDMLAARVQRTPVVNRVGNPRGGTKLEHVGATALMVMAGAQYQVLTGDTKRAALLDELGTWLLGRIHPNGRVSGASTLKRLQLHNALWRMYEATGEGKYLDALETLGKWDLEHRGDNGKKQIFEHPYLFGLWAIEPLTELYAVRPQPWIPELIFSVSDEVMKHQYTFRNATSCDHVGGFRPSSGRGHPNWNHTLKLEALADSWRMAERVGDTERAARYRERVLMATDFLLRFQHRKGELEGMAGGERAVGGVPLFVYNPRVRVDVPGHGGVAMMKVVEYLQTDMVPGAPLPAQMPAEPPAEPPVEP